MENTGTYGPDYDEQIDGQRIKTQMEKIRDYVLGKYPDWVSLAEIETATEYPQASISAQLRHLRKSRFGGYVVEKQRRQSDKGTWEYRAYKPLAGKTLFDKD